MMAMKRKIYLMHIFVYVLQCTYSIPIINLFTITITIYHIILGIVYK